MSSFPPPYPSLDGNTELQKAEAAKRLKSAWTSMIVSGIFTVLLVAWIASGIFTGRYTRLASGGQGTVLAIVGALIVARIGYRAYRLYNTWKGLKAAQDHHRSFN